MTKKLIVILVILIIVFQLPFSAERDIVAGSKSFRNGARKEIGGWIILSIQGDPYERGFQYGYLASEEIIEIIHRWCDWISNNSKLLFTKTRNKDKIWELYKTKAKKMFLDKIPEEYTEEMRGIADGINYKNVKLFGREVTVEDILTLQLVQDVYYSCFRYPLKRFSFINRFCLNFINFLSEIIGKEENKHCIAFIATGDATRNRELIVAHSTLFSPLIAEKCNLILEIKPSSGYSFVMTTYPGAIWSCEDYYQNEKGIVMVETELPQGNWKDNGVPKGVRSRNAIQYSDSIDDVIHYLMEGNNGLIPNEWLIGDTKTGEIASLEQALFNTPIKRTFNGFYWSCNFPHEKLVKMELYGLNYILIDVLNRLNLKIGIFAKVNKLIEIEREFYGKIDIETAKNILSTEPLSKGLTDGKITTSSLLKEMGLIACFGNPKNASSITSQHDDLNPSGWITISFKKFVNETNTNGELVENNYQEHVNNEKREFLSYCLILSIAFLTSFIILNIYKRRYKNRN